MMTTNSNFTDNVHSRRILYYSSVLLMALLPLLFAVWARLALGEIGSASVISDLNAASIQDGPYDMTMYFATDRVATLPLALNLLFTVVAWFIFVFCIIIRKERALILLIVPFTVLFVSAFSAYNSDFLLRAGNDHLTETILAFYHIRYLHGIYPIILYSAIIIGFLAFILLDIRAGRKVQAIT